MAVDDGEPRQVIVVTGPNRAAEAVALRAKLAEEGLAYEVKVVELPEQTEPEPEVTVLDEAASYFGYDVVWSRPAEPIRAKPHAPGARISGFQPGHRHIKKKGKK
jgi:hypothetical protein